MQILSLGKGFDTCIKYQSFFLEKNKKKWLIFSSAE